jgi:DNA-directed RNA polymerase subunit K/omega
MYYCRVATKFPRRTALSIPLDTLIDNETNVYEMTCVAISMANILSANGDQEIENNNGKVVSTVLEKVLTEDVEYTSDTKE